MVDVDYKTLYNQFPGAVVILDSATGRILDCNSAAERLTGRSRNEMVGTHHASILAGNNATNTNAKFLDLVKRGHATNYKTEVLTKHGDIVPVVINTSNTRVKGKDAVIQVFTLPIEDAIPAEHRTPAEIEVRKSQERMTLLFEHAPDGHFITDPEGKILSCNRAGEEITGYRREELLGKSLLELRLIATEDIPKATEILSKSRKERVGPEEIILVRQDGRLPPVEITSMPIALGDETIVLTVVHDITKRRLAERTIRQRERLLRNLFTNVNDVVAFVDLAGRLTDINDKVTDLFGYSRDELVGCSFGELPMFSKEAIAALATLFAQGLALRRTFEPLTDVSALHRDGRQLQLEISSSPLNGDRGQLIGFVCIIRDITARKTIEDKLIRSERYFRALIEHAPDAITVIDETGKILYSSSSSDTILGIQADTFSGTFDQVIHPDDLQSAMTALQEILANPGHHVKSALRVKRSDGTWRYVEGIGTNHLKDPAVGGVVINMRDITERVLAEAAQRESERMLQQIFNNVGDLILLIDTSGNIVNVNERSWDMLGYHPSEMIGRHVLELNVFDKGEASKVAALLTEAIEQGKFGNRLLEIQARHRDGHIVPVEISSARLFSEGQIKGFLSIIRDITERKQAEEELAKVKRDADAKIIQSAKLASLGEMAAGIAHEINQPLNVIKMTTTGILDFIDEGKEVQQEMLKSELEKTDRQVERMRGVIDHMRTFSRRSAALLLEPVDMNVPLRDAFSMIGQQLKLREIEVQRDLQELPKVLADSNKLEQVFLNLITNARDAMDELAQTAEEGHKKILKVRSFVEDGKATVTISDTGGGIPEQQRQRVFEPFFTTKDPGKGTGLGLSISYNIIKEFKGIIDFTVQEGAGTTFKVAIPIAQSNDTNSGTQGHD